MTSFKKKRILITGIDGFIGSNLAQKLEELGADVYGISHSREQGKTIKSNITEFNHVDKIITDLKIQICFHLAGVALVEEGQKDPLRTFKVNIDGTLNVLESARLHNLEKLIIASTCQVYGDSDPPFKEEYPPRPSRPYETSKACNDLIAQSYADSFSLPVLIPRFVNVYGPGDMNFTRLIPKTIRAVLNGEFPTMWGGSAERNFLYISDVVNAYIKLAETSIEPVGKNRIFNFGAKQTASVREIIEKIIQYSGNQVEIQKIEDLREAEIKSQYVSSAKAKRILRWEQEVSFDEGLNKTIDWYRKIF